VAMHQQMPAIEVHHHSASLRTAAEEARRILVMRGLVRQQDGLLMPVQAKQDLLRYYANSIAHLLPDGPLGLEQADDAATALGVSATARS
jgi:glycerol-3-phosphate O-acyltransferase